MAHRICEHSVPTMLLGRSKAVMTSSGDRHLGISSWSCNESPLASLLFIDTQGRDGRSTWCFRHTSGSSARYLTFTLSLSNIFYPSVVKDLRIKNVRVSNPSIYWCDIPNVSLAG